jgi:hypothetical protein
MNNLGGSAPPTGDVSKQWLDLIQIKAAHLGNGRVDEPAPPWPVPEDDVANIALARHVLTRLVEAAQGDDPRARAACRIAELGLRYLDDTTEENLQALAALT